MANKQPSFFIQLNTLFYAMMAGAFLFALAATFLQESFAAESDEALGNWLPALAIGWAVSSAFAADFLFKKKLEGIRADQPLGARQDLFRAAFIMKIAFLEGAALFCITAFLITGSTWALVAGIGALGWMSLNRPSLTLLQDAMKLSPAEMEAISSGQV